MLAYRRYRLAGLLAAAAIVLTAAPAAHHAAQPTRPALADCPAGTNWNNVLQRCV